MKKRGRSRGMGDYAHTEEEMMDEVDAFHAQRDKVALGAPRRARESAQEDSSDEEALAARLAAEEEDEEEEEEEEEEAAARPSGDGEAEEEEEEEGGDDDEDEEDEDEAAKLQREDEEERFRERKQRLESHEKAIPKQWGAKARGYYSSDTAEFEVEEDEDVAAEEEEEALRLQRERAAELRAEDFEDGTIGAAVVAQARKSKEKAAAARRAERAAERKREEAAVRAKVREKFHEESADEAELEKEEEDEQEAARAKLAQDGRRKALPVKLKKTKQGKGVVLPAPEAEADGGEEKKEGSGADEAENGERSTLPDLGGADAEVERVSKDVSKLSSDEKLELVRRDAPELLALVEELKQKTREVREKLAPLLERARQKGAAETAKGVSLLEVKYHALLHYVTLLAFFLLLKAEGRTVKDHPVVKRLVMMRGLMEKIKPIEQKLSHEIDRLLARADAAVVANTQAVADPLAFRANAKALAEAGEEADQADGGAADDGGVYEAPRLAAVEFRDDKAAKKESQRLAKLARRAADSSLLRDLRRELSDAPEEVSYGGCDDAAARERERQREIDQYEEENMVRLAVSKSDARKRREAQRGGTLEIADDFKDIAEFVSERAAERDTEADGELGLAEYRAAKKRKLLPAESAAKSRRGPREADVLDEEALKEGLDAYREMAGVQKRRKEEHKAKHAPPESLLNELDPDTVLPEDGRRAATKKILQNRGLTRSRPRDTKTPRAKRRAKFETALTKRRSQVREFAGYDRHGEERTGIKTHVVKSVKLK